MVDSLPSLAAWVGGPLADHLAVHAETAPDDPSGGGRWVGVEDLLVERGPLTTLAAGHVAAGATPAAAAKWLCGWFAGGVADAVGYTLALTSAALVVDPVDVLWRVAVGGYPDVVRTGPARAVVAPGHPWQGQPGVDVVTGQDEVDQAALRSVVAVGELIVPVCGALAKVGRRALWAEVADRFGLAVAYDLALPVDHHLVDRVGRALRARSAPWTVTPTLSIALGRTGPAYVGRKGGCCLAYQSAGLPAADGPAYCTSCPLREPADSSERFLEWVDGERRLPDTARVG